MQTGRRKQLKKVEPTQGGFPGSEALQCQGVERSLAGWVTTLPMLLKPLCAAVFSPVKKR